MTPDTPAKDATGAGGTTVPETPAREEEKAHYRTQADDDISVSSLGTSTTSKKRKRGTRSRSKAGSLPSGFERMSEILKEAENLHEKAKEARPNPPGSSAYNPTRTKTNKN